MAKDQAGGLLGIVAWLTGILVSLAVGFGMVYGTLSVPFLPLVVLQIAGWIVVAGSIISVIMAVFNK